MSVCLSVYLSIFVCLLVCLRDSSLLWALDDQQILCFDFLYPIYTIYKRCPKHWITSTYIVCLFFDESLVVFLICKSLGIKSSAKCINVSVYLPLCLMAIIAGNSLFLFFSDIYIYIYIMLLMQRTWGIRQLAQNMTFSAPSSFHVSVFLLSEGVRGRILWGRERQTAQPLSGSLWSDSAFW